MSATAEVVVHQAEGVNVPTSAIKADTVTVVRDGKHVTQSVTPAWQGTARRSSSAASAPAKRSSCRHCPRRATTSLTSKLSSRLGRSGSGLGIGIGGGGDGGGFAGRRSPLMPLSNFRGPVQRAPRARRRPLVERGGARRAGPGRPAPRRYVLHDVSKTYGLGEPRCGRCATSPSRSTGGDFVAIMGSSGSGKSTLMNILGCLDHPTRGEYRIDGVDICRPGRGRPGRPAQPQDRVRVPELQPAPAHQRAGNVDLPLAYARATRRGRRRQRGGALAEVGDRDRAHHQPSQLSGGQQQRVAIARALVNQPDDHPRRRADRQPRLALDREVLAIFERLTRRAGRS